MSFLRVTKICLKLKGRDQSVVAVILDVVIVVIDVVVVIVVIDVDVDLSTDCPKV